MSVKCILQGQNDKSLKLDDSVLKQDNEDVTSQVKSALNAADATTVNGHITDTSIHVTDEEKAKLSKAVTTSGVVYNSALPAKPTTPIAADEEIPYSWDEINTITLAGKAQEYFSLGATKLVNLSTAVLGANAATMMVIGFNQDGENTTTFQTKGTLPTTTAFGSSAVWIDSTVRTECQNFYNACEAKNFIKTVSKGTCLNKVSSKNGTATYNDETVWIPSETEMGLDNYSSLTKSNSTTSNSECTQGYNAAYSYYTSNTTRVKYQMSADGSLTTSTDHYWERSHSFFGSDAMCYVGSDGTAGGSDYSGYYSYSFGFAPAFVIGNGETPKDTLTQDSEDITDKVKEIVKPTIEEIGAAANSFPQQNLPPQKKAGWWRIAYVPKYDSSGIIRIENTYGSSAPTSILLSFSTSGGGLKALTYDGYMSNIPFFSNARMVNGTANNIYIDIYTAFNISNHGCISLINTGVPGAKLLTPTFVASDDTLPNGETLSASMEYLNPPMKLGVEYRTTERYQGKPVYKQLLNLGSAPAQGTVKTIDIPPNSADQQLVQAMLTHYGIDFPKYKEDGTLSMYIYVSPGSKKIFVYSPGEDRSANGEIHALLKYTKSTD